MPRTVDEAFTQLLGRLTPTTTESQAAISHRGSIEAALKNAFRIVGFFRSGSFGFGTSVSGYSDVDYFALVPREQVFTSSTDTLNAFAGVLRTRFPNTGIWVDAPAVVVPFGNSQGERHEIIPAVNIKTLTNGDRQFAIPDRVGGWLTSSPDAHARWINGVNLRRVGKLKPLIRLVKAWAYYNNVPIRSFYIEARTTEYADTQQAIMFKHDLRIMLRRLSQLKLAPMLDPTIAGTTISPGYLHNLQSSLTDIGIAAHWAETACNSEVAGKMDDAFFYWNLIFSAQFPGRY